MADSDQNMAFLYDLEGSKWWLFILRVNAKYVPNDDNFAVNMRIYYNRLFGGDTIDIVEDYFEDSYENEHRFGYSEDGYYRGYIADVVYYNVGLVIFESMYIEGVTDCEACDTCPSTKDW